MTKYLLLFSLLFSTIIYSYEVDSGTTGIEFNIGNVFFLRKDKFTQDPLTKEIKYVNQNLSFWYIAHNYIKYKKVLFSHLNSHFFFNSHLGINKNLIMQNAINYSYKNIFAGIIVGNKFKYLKGWGILVPEFSVGGAFNIISDWFENEGIDKHSLSFFLGVHLGTGVWLDISRDIGLIGIKFDYNIGYNNYINLNTEREITQIYMISVSFDFYDD